MVNEIEIFCKYDKLVSLENLVSNPKNRNIHNDKQIEVLSKIIKSKGWRHPIIVSKRSGYIVMGHGRLEAAKLLNLENVPVDYQDFKNEAEEYSVMVADNEIARYAEFDRQGFLDDLENLNIDLNEVDFNDFGLIDFNFNQPEAPDYGDRNDEIDTDNFGNDLEHTCPKCGFEFND